MSIDVLSRDRVGLVCGIRQSNREASQTRDLSGRKERDPFARLAQILRRAKYARLRMTRSCGIPP